MENNSKAKECGRRLRRIRMAQNMSQQQLADMLFTTPQNISKYEKEVITGKELDYMTDVELYEKIDSYTVFAKLLSGQKLRVVKALQNNNIVAVTGNNIEDMSSLKQADVGIGLGVSGCDFVKENSKLITNDDSISSIVNGINTSRKAKLNIVKMIEYLVSTNIAQLLLMTFIVVSFSRNFFAPTLILWINFASTIIPCVALGREKIKCDINDKVNIDNLIKNRVKSNIFIYGLIQFILVALLYILGIFVFNLSERVIITMCFVALCFMTVFHAYNIKSRKSVFVSNPFNNKLLNYGVFVSIVITILFVALPITVLQSALGTSAITPLQWLISFAVGFAIIPIAEIVKLLGKLRKK